MSVVKKWFCDLRTKITGLSNYMIGISRRGRWTRDYLLFMQIATILISSAIGRRASSWHVPLGYAELKKTCCSDCTGELPVAELPGIGLDKEQEFC